tara:strand:- start:811 stop:1503 length:693 start_codon:yes stop_codon:yes gene_type:complete
MSNVHVAEIDINMGELYLKPENVEMIEIESRIELSVSQYKRMFYFGSGKFFHLAPAYSYPNKSKSIQNSFWAIEDNNGLFYNFNKLGGVDNLPHGIYMAYRGTQNGENPWQAQTHLKMKFLSSNLTTFSESNISDILFNLSFIPDESNYDVELFCSRDWLDIEKDLLNFCSENNKFLKIGSRINFFLNVKIGFKNLPDILVKIKYRIKITQEDLGNYEKPSEFQLQEQLF